MSRLAPGKCSTVSWINPKMSPAPLVVANRNFKHFTDNLVLASSKASLYIFATVAAKIMLSLVMARLPRASEVRVAKVKIWYLLARARSSNSFWGHPIWSRLNLSPPGGL